jgi:hypothetical protein
MRLVAALALACGSIAAPLLTAQTATAGPWAPCDSADCVPYVARNAEAGAACFSGGSRYVFGLDPAGRTMICPTKNRWQQSDKPLIGVRSVRLPCADGINGVAQSPDGQPLSCMMGGWTPDFDAVYY